MGEDVRGAEEVRGGGGGGVDEDLMGLDGVKVVGGRVGQVLSGEEREEGPIDPARADVSGVGEGVGEDVAVAGGEDVGGLILESAKEEGLRSEGAEVRGGEMTVGEREGEDRREGRGDGGVAEEFALLFPQLTLSLFTGEGGGGWGWGGGGKVRVVRSGGLC